MASVYEMALEAVRRLFGDTSVTRDETRAALEELRDEINLMLETLQD